MSRGVGGGLILSVEGGTIAEVRTALRELLIRHVDAGTIPGGVALLGAGNVEVVTAGVASIGAVLSARTRSCGSSP